MREFACHEAAADDHQMLWQFGYSHDVVAGVVVHPAVEDGWRNLGAGTRGDHHLFGGELRSVVGPQQVAAVVLHAREAGVRVVDIDVGLGPPVVLAADRDRVDAAEDPRDDVVPSDPVDVGVDAVTRCVADGFGDFGRVDEHLGGNASDVEAGATERSLLADRHPLLGVAVVENAVAGTGSDDRQVVAFHPIALQPFWDATWEAAPR